MTFDDEPPTITVTLTLDEANALLMIAYIGSQSELAKKFYPRNSRVSRVACHKLYATLPEDEQYGVRV